jgi:hypothetical protein
VSSKKPDVGFSTGGVELRHASEDSAATSGGATNNKVTNLKPVGRSGLVSYDVEYRVVADLGGGRTSVVELVAPGSAQVRMPVADAEAAIGTALPATLDAAQTGVKDAAKAWRDAEVAADAIRHDTEVAVNRLAPVAARLGEVAVARLGELAVATRAATAAAGRVTTTTGLHGAAVDTADAVRTEVRDLADLVERRREAVRQVDEDQQASDDDRRAAEDRLTEATTAHANAENRLVTATADVETAAGNLETARRTAARLTEARDLAVTGRERAVADHDAVKAEIATAEADLEQARTAVDTGRQAWWRAKTAVDQEVATYNTTNAPPPARHAAPTRPVPPVPVAAPTRPVPPVPVAAPTRPVPPVPPAAPPVPGTAVASDAELIPAAPWSVVPHAPHSILSDESWRHSDAPSADWSRPSDPVSTEDIRAARHNAPISTVRSEDGGLLTTSTVAPGKVDFKAWRSPIAYDKRMFEVDGVKVQDYTVKVHLDASGPDVDALKARTQEGVDALFNQGHRLPGGDQLHVTVEFTDNPADAHGHIAVTDPDGRANQLNWPVDTDSRRLAHEVGHFLGLQDEYVEPGRAKPVFQHQPGRGRVVADNGPMTAGIDSPTMEIKPRNLWLIETRSNALASPNLLPPSAFESDAAPPNAPAVTSVANAEALVADARRAEAAARVANVRADREVDHRADALFTAQDDQRRVVLTAEFQTALEERATAVADAERRTREVQEATAALAEQQRIAGTPPVTVADSTVPAATTPSSGRPTDVLDWAGRMPLVNLALNDPGAGIRQGQSTREHVRRVLDVLGRPEPRTFPGLVRILPRITEVTAPGPEVATRNDAVALASVVDNVARDMSEAFNDPLLKPVFARKIIESQADRLRWDGDASSSMSPETVRLAGALVSDDPLTSFMRGDAELPAVAARIEAVAERAGLDPRTTFDLLRRRYEAEMLSYTLSEVYQGELERDADADGDFVLTDLPGEIAPGYHRGAVELRQTTSQRFLDTLKRDKPGAPEWNNKDLVLTKDASDRLDGVRAVLAPAPVSAPAAVWVPPAPDVAPTVGHPPAPAPLPFTAADLTTGRNGLAPSTATTAVPLPGSEHAGSLTQRQYEHLRDIRTNRAEAGRVDTAAAARRDSVKHDLVGKLGVPDLAVAEQVLAKAETWFATAPITISLKGETLFGTDEAAAALARPNAQYLAAAEIGLSVVDSSTLATLRTKRPDVEAHRAEVERLLGELEARGRAEGPNSPEFKALQSEHQRAKTTLAAAELDAARTPRQIRYLEGLLAEDPDFSFWTLSNEVNSARGDNYTRWRREKDDVESGRRGFGPHEAAVFGAVNVNYDRTKGFEGTDYYGETHLLLDPRVRQRSYFTFGTKGPERGDVVDLMHDMFAQDRIDHISGIVQNAVGLDGMVPQSSLLLETHVYGGVVFARDVAEVSVPRTGLDPDVRARIEDFAEVHGITVVESDPATWPALKAWVDATALRDAMAPAAVVPPQGAFTANRVPSVVKDRDGRTSSITGDLFSV